MTVVPMSAKGVLGQLELIEGQVRLSRGGLSSLKGKDIAISSISSMQWKDASLLTNGYIRFALFGGAEPKGGLLQATQDENAMMFRTGHQAEFEAIRDEVQRRIDAPANYAPTSEADGIKGFEAVAAPISAVDVSQTDSAPCPFCAEPIKRGAVKCRYCRETLPQQWSESQVDRARIIAGADSPSTTTGPLQNMAVPSAQRRAPTPQPAAPPLPSQTNKQQAGAQLAGLVVLIIVAVVGWLFIFGSPFGAGGATITDGQARAYVGKSETELRSGLGTPNSVFPARGGEEWWYTAKVKRPDGLKCTIQYEVLNNPYGGKIVMGIETSSCH